MHLIYYILLLIMNNNFNIKYIEQKEKIILQKTKKIKFKRNLDRDENNEIDNRINENNIENHFHRDEQQLNFLNLFRNDNINLEINQILSFNTIIFT